MVMTPALLARINGHQLAPHCDLLAHQRTFSHKRQIYLFLIEEPHRKQKTRAISDPPMGMGHVPTLHTSPL